MKGEPIVLRGRVTPDPEQARLLESKLRSINYTPTRGFLRDQKQARLQPLAWQPRTRR
jgi:predicted RNase H-like nuclease (RuvC/YqgF family)